MGYRCYDPISDRLRISCNVVFWEHRSFVKLSHFCASLSTSIVLDFFFFFFFPDKPHIPSIVTPNPSIDFFIQPPDIFDASPRSYFNEQVKGEPPNPELWSPTPTPPEDLAQDIPPCHSTQVRSILIHLLNYHCYTALAALHEPHTYYKVSTDPL